MWEWLLILPRHSLLTAGFTLPVWHMTRASSSPKLPNTVLTRSQFGMAKAGLEPTTLLLDIRFSSELHFLRAQRCTPLDRSDQLTTIVSRGRCGRPDVVQKLMQASTASAILKYQPLSSLKITVMK